MPNNEVIDKIIDNLPTFDSVIQELITLVNDEYATATKLENVIKKDPVLSIKILKLANSSFFSPVKPITTISHSIRYIGFSTLKSLVYSIALQSIGSNNGKVSVEIKRLHQKSLVNAIISMMIGKKYLAKQAAFYSPDSFYIFGLFHDIGLLALANHEEGVIYKDMLQKIESSFDEEDEEIRTENYITNIEKDYDHSILGKKIMIKWELPEFIAEFIEKHHETNIDKDSKLYLPLKVVNISEYLAYLLGYDSFADTNFDIKSELEELGLEYSEFFDDNDKPTQVKEFVDSLMSSFNV